MWIPHSSANDPSEADCVRDSQSNGINYWMFMYIYVFAFSLWSTLVREISSFLNNPFQHTALCSHTLVKTRKIRIFFTIFSLIVGPENNWNLFGFVLITSQRQKKTFLHSTVCFFASLPFFDWLEIFETWKTDFFLVSGFSLVKFLYNSRVLRASSRLWLKQLKESQQVK